MKRKEKYESPFMERTSVEVEDGFCAGSVVVTNDKNAAIAPHDVNDDFTTIGDFSGTEWDTTTNQ